MKYIDLIFLFFLITCSPLVSSASEVDSKLQEVFEKIDQKDWTRSMELLLTYPEGNAEVNLLWGLWYGGAGNPEYDLVVLSQIGGTPAHMI